MSFRFPVLAHVLPAVSLASLADEIAAWWDDWIAMWGDIFDPAARRAYRAQRQERDDLDADQIADGGGNSFASDSGGDW